MSDKLEDLKKELVVEIQSLANDLSKNQTFVGLLSYESKFKSLHEKFINLKFLERKHLGMDIFDTPIPLKEEKQETFSDDEEKLDSEETKEYTFNKQKDDEFVIEKTESKRDKEDNPTDEIAEKENKSDNIKPSLPQDSFAEIMSHEIDDFSDLLPKPRLPQLQIDFNDRIAFLNQLFAGDSAQLDATIDTLNNTTSLVASKKCMHDLAKEMNWKGKEEYIERLMELIEKRFD